MQHIIGEIALGIPFIIHLAGAFGHGQALVLVLWYDQLLQKKGFHLVHLFLVLPPQLVYDKIMILSHDLARGLLLIHIERKGQVVQHPRLQVNTSQVLRGWVQRSNIQLMKGAFHLIRISLPQRHSHHSLHITRSHQRP